MKKRLNHAALSAFLLVFVLVLAGCGETSPGGVFDMKLRGTWETHDPEIYGYSGTLVIDWNTITISGYDQEYYSLKEAERPFKDITKNIPRKGYTEEGKIYIDDFGWKEGIAYEYDGGMSPNYIKLLRFNFAGRNETLRKTKD
jgi:hypothetical protein